MIKNEYGLWIEEYFTYNGEKYGVGTEFWFTGLCYLRGSTVFLKNERCVFKYVSPGDSVVFDVNGETAWCSIRAFRNSIHIGCETETESAHEELYLSEKSFNKLLWYIIIMVVGVIFYDRWLIWIGATIVFITTTPEVKQFLKGGK